MPKYHFNVQGYLHEPDVIGIEIGSDSAAIKEAIQFLGEIIKGDPDRLLGGDVVVEVLEGGKNLKASVSATLVKRRI